ncbi:hypothetical protein F9C07_2220235 [Aspergillus flavus]|uniref:AB hydrolase-1 domain-containing protein n=1 Tax=Aspergillus flavus (strain ATCC 200026 / FGSC A1120 / IAM 13836 / NRRL 3357 / JCM 12722 / SRRC 167) TaxID=332952 RepID=A0A7U2MYB8_ASPFN|nr:hypothetical protein F9C07_2220235 [Aspergillus flavus]
MSSNNFRITEHTVPGCHIREYAGSTAGRQEDVLRLHVKQYTPLNPPEPLSPEAVTITELYEPLWNEILQRAERNSFQIRSIWVAEAANMGMSAIFNEDKLSIGFSWMDHYCDLLFMINYFRDEMPRPLVGLGHSFGGNIITNLVFLYPRLFTTLILLDPVIQLNPLPMGFGSDPLTATEVYKEMFPKMDPRCVDRTTKFGFRDLPTELYPESLEGSNPANPPVTLTTSRYQDMIAQIRENFSARTLDGRIQIDRSTHAEMDPIAAFFPIYLRLDEVREGIKICGHGIGGSGGDSQGKVKEAVIPKGSHLFPFENVAEAAEISSAWLGKEVQSFAIAEREWAEKRQSMDKRDHLVLGEEWFKTIKPLGAFRSARKPGKERL